MRVKILIVVLGIVGDWFVVIEEASAQIVFEGHTYLLTPSAMNWMQAESLAMTMGGHLTAVNTQQEQAFLSSTFCGTPFPFWIGFTDQLQEGIWVWTTGEPVSYTNWHPGEPNNDAGLGDWAAMNWHFARGDGPQFQGNWNDTPLGGTTGFPGNTNGPYFGIIEIVGIPEPTSLALMGVSAVLLSVRSYKCRAASIRH